MRVFSRRSFLVLAGSSFVGARLGVAQAPAASGAKTPNVKPGVWPVMFTPFTESKAVDFDALKELVEFYVTAGVAGIFAGCLSGEVFNLTFDEVLEIGRRVVEHAAGRVGVVVGANFGTTLEEQAASLARMGEAGVDASVVLLSKLPSADDIEGQLTKLMDLTKGPLGIYECPWPEHRQISPEALGRMAHTGRFYFLKETSRLPAPCGEKAQLAKGTPLRVFAATLAATPKALELGADGHCGTVADICPELTGVMCRAQDPAERDRVFQSLTAINGLMTNNAYPCSGKYILQKRGLHLTTVARETPKEPFTDEVRRKLDEFLKKFDFQKGVISG